ncbi:MAG: hypothetical protein K2X29_15030 [Candidatus Obscuribacterales bacterium]|nr:hypothetical protein [Candidatus Obscuribacterales bacterium]
MSPLSPQLNITSAPQLTAIRGADEREPISQTSLSDETANFHVASSRLSRSLEMRASFYQTFLSYIQQFTRPELNVEVSRAFKAELASLFESFAKVLRNEASLSDQDESESDDLRKQLVDAKDQIISLLTERASDQVRITQLETELKFLPDLQAQADRALTLADSASKVQDSLQDLRLQLNDAHLSRMRHKLHRGKPRSWWSKVASHFVHVD